MATLKYCFLTITLYEPCSDSSGDSAQLKPLSVIFFAQVNLRTMTPSGLLSVKLFGNELDLFTLKDLQWLEEDDLPLVDIIDLLRTLSRGIDKTYTKSIVFLEESYVVPTCLGIPLNLSINGTSVTSVHVQGKADLLNMFWGKKRAVVKGTVKPR